MEDVMYDIQASKVLKQKHEEAKKIITNHDSSNTCLDLANKSIQVIPKDLSLLTYIEHLYLEGNHLRELPKHFFESLPKLKWLDLRNNQLIYLPASIGKHRNVKNLLLENNHLTQLPLELGFVRTITGLNLRGNPLVVPPNNVVQQGTQAVLSYLREESYNQRNSTEIEEDNESLSDEDSDYSYNEEVERLNIPSPVHGENEFEFNPLKHGPTPIPAKFHHPGHSGRSKNVSWRGKHGDINAAYIKPSEINIDRLANGSSYKSPNKKEYMLHLHQKKKNAIVLDEWREEAKRLQQNLLPRSKTDLTHATNPPYAVDGPPVEARPVTREEQRILVNGVEEKVDRIEPTNVKTKERIDNEVQARIRLHTSQLHNRKKNNPNNILQPGRELQRELLSDKMARDPQMEYRFKAFTGDSSSFTSSNKTSSL